MGVGKFHKACGWRKLNIEIQGPSHWHHCTELDEYGIEEEDFEKTWLSTVLNQCCFLFSYPYFLCYPVESLRSCIFISFRCAIWCVIHSIYFLCNSLISLIWLQGDSLEPLIIFLFMFVSQDPACLLGAIPFLQCNHRVSQQERHPYFELTTSKTLPSKCFHTNWINESVLHIILTYCVLFWLSSWNFIGLLDAFCKDALCIIYQ